MKMLGLALFMIFIASTALAVSASVPLFSCTFDGFELTVVNESAFPYTVSSASTGAPWLENGTFAIQSAGRLLIPGSGLESTGPPIFGQGVDGILGSFSFLSLDWQGVGVGSLVTNFTCYTDFGLVSFSTMFPDGLSPLVDGLSGNPDVPSTRFPCFSAGSGSALLSDAMGFVSWAGEMDTYKNSHGTGLKGYSGG
jgi:hypothetical protein